VIVELFHLALIDLSLLRSSLNLLIVLHCIGINSRWLVAAKNVFNSANNANVSSLLGDILSSFIVSFVVCFILVIWCHVQLFISSSSLKVTTFMKANNNVSVRHCDVTCTASGVVGQFCVVVLIYWETLKMCWKYMVSFWMWCGCNKKVRLVCSVLIVWDFCWDCYLCCRTMSRWMMRS